MKLGEAREILIDYSRSKLNGQFPLNYRYQHQMTNPLCGDRVEIRFNASEQRLSEIGFSAKACAICTAATAMMTKIVQGQTVDQALKICTEFENQLLAPADTPWPSQLIGLKSFEHLKINQARRTCALLPWVVLRVALKELK